MDIFSFFYRQVVTQSQMDWAFERAQTAQHALTTDHDAYLILDSLDPQQHAPVPDKSVDVTGPGVAYDKDGQRCYVPDAITTVDCSQDEYGSDTDPAMGEDRYISVFLRFARDYTEPKLDGNNVTVYTEQLEDYEFFVRMGASAVAPTPTAVLPDAVLICDILVSHGFTAIQNADIDVSRREDWIRYAGTTIGDRVYGTPKEGLEDVLALLDTWGGALPFAFTSTWFGAVAVAGVAPPPTTIQEALDAVVYDLAQATGGALVGAADYVTAGAFVGWVGVSIQGALETIADAVDAHIGGAAPFHPATAITTAAIPGAPESEPGASDVQAVLANIFSHLNDRTERASYEQVTGAWDFWTAGGPNPARSDLQQHFRSVPFLNTAQGGPQPHLMEEGEISSALYSTALTHPIKCWGSMHEDYNKINPSGGTLSIKDACLVWAGSGQRLLVVIQPGAGGNTPIYLYDCNDLSFYGSFLPSANLPTGGGEQWLHDAICSDGDYIYLLTHDIAAAPNDVHRVHAFDVAGNPHPGWAAQGTALFGTGTHPAIGSGGQALPDEIIIADDNYLAVGLSWVPLTGAANDDAIQLVLRADGSAVLANRDDGDFGTTGYLGTCYFNGGLASDGTNVYFTVLDTSGAHGSWVASLQIAAPANGSGLPGFPLNRVAPVVLASLACSGRVLMAPGSDGTIEIFDLDAAGGNIHVQNDGSADALYSVIFDGLNFWVLEYESTDQLVRLLKIPAARLNWSANATVGDVLDRVFYCAGYDEVNGGAPSNFSLAQLGRMCWDGDAVWAVIDVAGTAPPSGQTHIRRLTAAALR